ncbi:MAG: hypothetical protein ACP5RN_09685 [Armatimonadota bacterium]
MRDFTGNPFVDAGMAGMCAAAEVDGPQHLDMQAVRKAVDTLYHVVLSDSAFVEKPPYKRFATSTMAMIFPNSPLPQASFSTPEKKREKYRERIEMLLRLLEQSEHSSSETSCFVCGQPAPLRLGIDWFPLMASTQQMNFHPMLTEGHPVCAFCALCVQFLPLSVLQTKAEGGRLWFVHSPDAGIVVTIAREYGLSQLQALVAAGEPLRFAGNWACPGENGAVVSLLNELGKRHARLLEQTQHPVSAFMFSNDNREQFIRRIPVPHRLIEFFNALQLYPESRDRFEKEILHAQLGGAVAEQMLHEQPIIATCTRHDGAQLLGGWEFHRLYAEEVLGMNTKYICTVQEVASRLTADENATKALNALKRAREQDVFGVLLSMVREGWMTRQELHLLAPPGERYLSAQARDYLLAAVYALQSGEQFSLLPVTEEGTGTEHPLVARIEQVGQELVEAMDEAKRLRDSLRQAQRPQEIRRALLRLLVTGHLSWQDFLFFCPPDDVNRHYQSRDYWLAFLYDRLRQEVGEEEPGEEQLISKEA